MGLKDTLQKIHFSPFELYVQDLPLAWEAVLPREGHKMSHVQQLLALTSSSCLTGSNGSGGSCTFGTDNERRGVCGKAWLKLFIILDLQNERKSLSLIALVDLGPHHSPGLTFQSCPHLSECTAPPASLVLVPNHVQRNKCKRKQKQKQNQPK